MVLSLTQISQRCRTDHDFARRERERFQPANQLLPNLKIALHPAAPGDWEHNSNKYMSISCGLHLIAYSILKVFS